MSEQKFTKGEWVDRNEKESYPNKIIGTSESTRNVCKILNWDEESKANAKLICAAPDLLKALQELLPLAGDGYQSNCRTASHEEFLQEDRSLLKNAREAIRKATS